MRRHMQVCVVDYDVCVVNHDIVGDDICFVDHALTMYVLHIVCIKSSYNTEMHVSNACINPHVHMHHPTYTPPHIYSAHHTETQSTRVSWWSRAHTPGSTHTPDLTQPLLGKPTDDYNDNNNDDDNDNDDIQNNNNDAMHHHDDDHARMDTHTNTHPSTTPHAPHTTDQHTAPFQANTPNTNAYGNVEGSTSCGGSSRQGGARRSLGTLLEGPSSQREGVGGGEGWGGEGAVGTGGWGYLPGPSEAVNVVTGWIYKVCFDGGVGGVGVLISSVCVVYCCCVFVHICFTRSFFHIVPSPYTPTLLIPSHTHIPTFTPHPCPQQHFLNNISSTTFPPTTFPPQQ